MTNYVTAPEAAPMGSVCTEPMLHGPCGRNARWLVHPVDASGWQHDPDAGGPTPHCGTHRLMHERRAAKAHDREADRLAEQARREQADQ